MNPILCCICLSLRKNHIPLPYIYLHKGGDRSVYNITAARLLSLVHITYTNTHRVPDFGHSLLRANSAINPSFGSPFPLVIQRGRKIKNKVSTANAALYNVTFARWCPLAKFLLPSLMHPRCVGGGACTQVCIYLFSPMLCFNLSFRRLDFYELFLIYEFPPKLAFPGLPWPWLRWDQAALAAQSLSAYYQMHRCVRLLLSCLVYGAGSHNSQKRNFVHG